MYFSNIGLNFFFEILRQRWLHIGANFFAKLAMAITNSEIMKRWLVEHIGCKDEWVLIGFVWIIWNKANSSCKCELCNHIFYFTIERFQLLKLLLLGSAFLMIFLNLRWLLLDWLLNLWCILRWVRLSKTCTFSTSARTWLLRLCLSDMFCLSWLRLLLILLSTVTCSLRWKVIFNEARINKEIIEFPLRTRIKRLIVWIRATTLTLSLLMATLLPYQSTT